MAETKEMDDVDMVDAGGDQETVDVDTVRC